MCARRRARADPDDRARRARVPRSSASTSDRIVRASGVVEERPWEAHVPAIHDVPPRRCRCGPGRSSGVAHLGVDNS